MNKSNPIHGTIDSITFEPCNLWNVSMRDFENDNADPLDGPRSNIEPLVGGEQIAVKGTLANTLARRTQQTVDRIEKIKSDNRKTWTSFMDSFYAKAIKQCEKHADKGEWEYEEKDCFPQTWDEVEQIKKVLLYLKEAHTFFVIYTVPDFDAGKSRMTYTISWKPGNYMAIER